MNHFLATADALAIQAGRERITIQAWGVHAVRVRAGQHRLDPPVAELGALLERTGPTERCAVTVAADGESAELVNGDLTVTARLRRNGIAAPDVVVRYLDTASGNELLADQPDHFCSLGARRYVSVGQRGARLEQYFAAYPDEHLVGMGQRTLAQLDVKGTTLELEHRNGEVSVPFVISNRGYGMLWNHPGLGRVSFATNGTRWIADQAAALDYWICAGSPSQVLGAYADATGHAPMMPDWALGFWQSKLRYLTQDELLDVAREHLRRELPLAVMVVDYFHWTAMGDYTFDRTAWPDPAAMVAELAEHGVHTMVSVWPTVAPHSINFTEFRDRGLLVGGLGGQEQHLALTDTGMATASPLGFLDPTNPATREFVWAKIAEGYLADGFDVFWLDACEPELIPARPDATQYHAGPGAEVAGLYPRETARIFSEGIAATGRPPTVLLCRSAWAGSQRYGAAVWSGDIPATWESLANQVRAGLNMGLSGIPWWTTDIGGFHGGNPDDAEYRALFVRWFQFGTFCPLMRVHGDRDPRSGSDGRQSGASNEVWSFGDEAYPILVEHMRLRERLRPYLAEQMRAASESGLPPMRPMLLECPDAPDAWGLDEQFMLGPDIVIRPITSPTDIAGSTVPVWLPADATWVEVATGAEHPGGAPAGAVVRRDQIPVFVRAGAAVLSAFIQ